MEPAILLAFDIGTSSVKTSMISAAGERVDAQSEAYPTRYAAGGVAEQDPADWWGCVCRTTRALLDRDPTRRGRVVGIGVCGHMLGCVPVDQSGAALHPCLIHADARAKAQYEAVDRAVGAERLYRMSGNILDARSSLCKQLWVKEALPDLYARTAKFLQCKDYITARLTGEIDTTDYSDASHGQLMDIQRRAYDPALYQELGLSMDKLPALHRGDQVVGHLREEAAKALGLPAGIPVIAGGGDGACGNVGAGAVAPGDSYLSLGTTAWIAQAVREPVFDPQRRLFNIMSLDGETCSLLGTTQAAGASINWVQRLLQLDLETLNRMAAQVEPGCEGLVFLPYLDGERTPVFDAEASGAFVGLRQKHGSAHMARAVLEGIAFALGQIADTLRQFNALKDLSAIGGGMNSQLLAGMVADVTRLRLHRLSVPAEDATSLGVAAAAGVGAGIFASLREATAGIQAVSTVEPGPTDWRYARNYSVYQGLYAQLALSMHRLVR